MDPDLSKLQSLTGTILLLPLMSALTIMLAHGLLKNVAHVISTGVALIILVASCMLLGADDATFPLLPFLNVGDFQAHIGITVDRQSRGMLFIVTFVGFLVHLYSMAYMKDDDAKARFFGALSLFMFSMIGIVFADNLLMMFLFWELVGVSSYLLIGHWFKKPEASDAAKKAFLTNRIGDFGFMTGILILFALGSGDLSFEGLKDSMEVASSPLKHASENSSAIFTLAALGIFLGAVGKSAQAPLHVWLPDAMEGPTPVSALIHAATMVAAGVYMLVRVDFLFLPGGVATITIAWIGGITALMAALIALQQNDIKKVLAYSTLSQLGYMVMAVGLRSPEESMFHLYTHAFFKALLFLGAGAVIHACHHEQDMWKMGGLRKKMPVTFITFVIGTAALMGVPFITSGFYSKEAILVAAYGQNKVLFLIGLFTALLTAFYMTRLVVVAFCGKARSKDADHAHEAPVLMIIPLVLLAIPSLASASHLFTGPLQALAPHGHGEGYYVVMVASIVVLIIGFLLGMRTYVGKDKDPVNLPLLANKFYFDELYAGIVKYGQDRLAWLVNAFEHIFVDGVTVRLPTALVNVLGGGFRRMQSGSLQTYTFLLGLGIVVAVYLAVFFAAKS
ncbi:NADH-quinone oxidoreductase subunit L [Phragmitibacter flavus]|uniref:NADH-quinone oxidoreductase subunit L n=1 Tax=Phragmitibacter flavus TaxID=2576071 RepID=A0A5R8KBS8_9BACT|nr:NADH-quinone oxidoreductase subunit L [Phragmitibacter flavus]TLD69758.1 NADH-quinone oxidoreductase subunit L [Phragmitibacter flavus]